MTKKHKPISDAEIEKMRDLGVHFMDVPNIGSIDLDDLDDIALFAQLAPIMVAVAEALGQPVPSHKKIKDALVDVRALAKLRSAKKE